MNKNILHHNHKIQNLFKTPHLFCGASQYQIASTCTQVIIIISNYYFANMKFTIAAISAAFLGSAVANTEVDSGALEAAINCNKELGKLEFVFLEDEAVVRSIEDDIRADLSEIGLNVVAKPLDKADLNTARQSGDFHLSISETWGLPYDPHSFAAGWIEGAGGEGIYPAMEKFEAPSTREELLDMVTEVLQLEDKQELETKWLDIHKYYHEQAVLMPLYGKRIPTVINRRLVGYVAGHQQFDYPVHRLSVDAGPKNVTISPGARNGLFHTVGTMNAHVYGPNEFFSNNWVYEGLVAFGANGELEPALATEWSTAPNEIEGDTYTFKLRQNVQFHDGALWSCSVAKLNFDHILAPPLAEVKHGWYGVGSNTYDWYCNDNDDFVMRTNVKHEAYLSELSLIRPTRMISPNSFIGDDALQSNSCHTEWETVEGADGSVTCVGIQSISGTGPFEYISEETIDGTTNSVLFGKNSNYWGTVPDIDYLKVVRYTSSDDVKDALLNDELDLVWGAGVLSDTDILDFRDDPAKSVKFEVGLSNPIQNAMLILNTGNPPLDNINVRKTVIHAINKGALVEKELPLSQQVDNIFPRGAPYCDVDLSPRWSYDFEKAVLLSCDGTAGNYVTEESSSDDDALAIGLGVGLGCALVMIMGVSYWLWQKNSKLEAELKMNLKEGAETV